MSYMYRVKLYSGLIQLFHYGTAPAYNTKDTLYIHNYVCMQEVTLISQYISITLKQDPNNETEHNLISA